MTIRDRQKTEDGQKSQMGIFCGYGRDTNANKVYLPDLNTLTTSGDVLFLKEDDYTGLLMDEEEAENTSVLTPPTPIGEGPDIAGVDKSGIILDYKAWLPCAVKCMENFKGPKRPENY